MTQKTSGEIIEEICREQGVDPNDTVFRAKLMKRLLAAGYFNKTK